ncbi:MAG: hypothetical protein HFJ19_04360 [Clostridia bacterium]|nr:hypothetical protein [Clostridia bacterium]
MKAIYISGQDKKSKIRQKLLLRYIRRKKKECNCIVIGKGLRENVELIEKIEGIGIPISDGRWLFKFLLLQILEYISNCQNISIGEFKIALVTDENNDLISYYIEELTKRSNKVKIITNHREKFYIIEEKLYYNKGIVLEISNNKRKGLQDVDIIFNFNFEEDKLNRYKLNDNAILINLKEKVNVNSKRFSGINIHLYEIDFENRLMNILDWTEGFEKNEIYESYLYRNDKIENIEQNIIKDKVIIKSLIGSKGKIKEEEYKNILDKTYYLA